MEVSDKSKKSAEKRKRVKHILISQARPEAERSPYFDLEKKYGVKLSFCPFVSVEGVTCKEFRQQKIDLAAHTAVVFTSRYAVDHFFRLCEEMRHKINPDMKYFCITEAVALYLQKFIHYRKRKVFHATDGTLKTLLRCIAKQKTKDSYIVPNSDAYRNELCAHLQQLGVSFAEATLFRTVNNDVSELLSKKPDLIVLFSPGGFRSLIDSVPQYKQNGTLLGAFGAATCKAIEDYGFVVNIPAPLPHAPSMVGALEQFLQTQK
ncbi:MAG: hypothetical protein RL660_87 [Bacteroidota bacterium]|jgi:uroporphyrinogen-III synthase